MQTIKLLTRCFLALFASAACAAAFAQAPPGAPAEAPSAALETNAAVRAALEIPRREPADYVKAVSWLIDLGRPELAKPILEELAKLQLTDAQRAALVEEFGSRTMLQIARTKELAPAAAEFADKCMAAAAAAANDPKRIAALVAQLTDPSVEARTIARNDLAATGVVGVAATLEALARETNPARRDALAAGAVKMDPLVVRPLLAMLNTNDANLRTAVAAILQQLKVPQAAPFVSASSASAERELTTAMDSIRRGVPPFEPDESDQVELWHWDDATKKLSAARYPADEAAVIWLAQLGRARSQFQPENRQYARQGLVFELEAAAYGPAKGTSPAIEELSVVETHVLDGVLADALKLNFPNAAIAAADALRTRGDVGVLFASNPQPSPLANALDSPNRRVRFAALRAIMALDPTAPYPGSSRVPEALAWFAGSTGERRALVAMPTNAAATSLAGMLARNGLHGMATNHGREVVKLALETADLEMIFVDMNLIPPDIRQVLYELRIHPTTGQIPIALMTAEGRLLDAEKLAEEHRRVIPVSRPHSPEVLTEIVKQLTTAAGRNAVPPEERVAQAKEAQAWLAGLGRRPFYNIRRSAPFDRNDSGQADPASVPVPIP